MKITVITWKDERWSADKEALAGINKMLREYTKTIKKEARGSFRKMFKHWVKRISNYRS